MDIVENCMLKSLLLLMIFFDDRRTLAVPIDNNVLGDPTIVCSTDFVDVEFQTRNAFYGKLYVKGQYANSQCLVDKSQTKEQSRGVTIRVVFGTCNVERRRSVNPKGVAMRSTIVIQEINQACGKYCEVKKSKLLVSTLFGPEQPWFHSHFVTKVDKAYQINCFYQEAVKVVTAGLDVSMLNTDTITNGYPMPICAYSIRKETLQGPTTKYAKVGDQVIHRWECHSDNLDDKTSAYGMLVHSCYVNDGSGNSELVIDDKGCGLDPYILGHLTYTDDLLTAYREAHVFKFADQPVLYFSCQIRLCMKTMDACRGMTPPKCSDLKNKRDLQARQLENVEQNSSVKGGKFDYSDSDENLVDVQSDNMFVFDSEDDSFLSLQRVPEGSDENYRSICLTVTATAVIFSVVGLLLLAVGVVLAFCIILKRHYSQQITDSILWKN